MNTKETLMKRGNEYGEFSLQAEMSQSMESVLRSGPGWKKMNPAQKEAAKMIVHKLARLANGNPHSFDGWHDIQGYAKLAEDRCPSPDTAAGAGVAISRSSYEAMDAVMQSRNDATASECGSNDMRNAVCGAEQTYGRAGGG